MSQQDQSVKRGELSVTTVGSTSILIHWSLAVAMLVIGFAIGLLVQRRAPDRSLIIVIGITVVIVGAIGASLIGRELVQTQIAKSHGLRISSLSLSATGARVRASSPPPHARAQFQISGGGLLFTVSVALVLFGLARLSGYYRLNDGLGETLTLLALMNAIVALVNLVPVAPLDAGRMVESVLWHRSGSRNSGQIGSSKVSIWSGIIIGVAAVALAFVNVAVGILFVLIAVMTAVVGRYQMRSAAVRRRLETTTAQDVAIKNPLSLPDSLTFARLEAWAGPEQTNVAYPVTRWDNDPIGYVIPTFAMPLSAPERSWTKIDQLMRPKTEVDRCWSGDTVDEILQRVTLTDDLIVVVHDPKTLREIGTLSYTQLSGLFTPPRFWGERIFRIRSSAPPTSTG